MVSSFSSHGNHTIQTEQGLVASPECQVLIFSSLNENFNGWNAPWKACPGLEACANRG